jgi:hypothetical protein
MDEQDNPQPAPNTDMFRYGAFLAALLLLLGAWKVGLEGILE